MYVVYSLVTLAKTYTRHHDKACYGPNMGPNQELTGWIFGLTPAACGRKCDNFGGCGGYTIQVAEGYCKLYDDCSYLGQYNDHDSYN